MEPINLQSGIVWGIHVWISVLIIAFTSQIANKYSIVLNNLQSGVVWGVHGVDGHLAALPAVQAVQLKL